MKTLTPPKGLNGVEKEFGKFTYTELSGGNILVPKQWEFENIVTLKNVVGSKCNVQLHVKVVEVFESAMSVAVQLCPGYKIRMLGGYVPRHKMHNPKLGLSTHSWGIAFDINWDTNQVGKKGTAKTDLPPEFVKAFTDRGWQWGGTWKTPDYMHFQFCEGI